MTMSFCVPFFGGALRDIPKNGCGGDYQTCPWVLKACGRVQLAKLKTLFRLFQNNAFMKSINLRSMKNGYKITN